MRRVETKDMLIYYPEGSRHEVDRLAPRFQYCVDQLKTFVPLKEKLRIVMPRVAYNNAYVPQAFLPHVALPTYNTLELFGLMGLQPDPAAIACHEFVHYMQRIQLNGIWEDFQTLFGYSLTPQSGLDSWFWEGLAVYYETKLQKGMGRLRAPYIRGLFAAAYAGEPIDGGDLSNHKRIVPTGGQYLLGAQFVDYLARRYGEEKLWDVMMRQSDELVPVVGVNLRFEHAYGKTLSALIDEFSSYVKERYPSHPKPSTQRTLLNLEQDARYVRSPLGYEALFRSGVDQPPTLTIRAPNGALLVEKRLVDTLQPRVLVSPSVHMMSGASFTSDHRFLYFVMVDSGFTVPVSRLIRIDVHSGKTEQVEKNLRGMGGSISPDGKRYYFVTSHGDRFDLAYFDIETHRTHILLTPPRGSYIHSPRVSPDGSKIAATVSEPSGFFVRVYEVRTAAMTRDRVPVAGDQFLPSWQGNDALVFSAPYQGLFQIYRYALGSSSPVRITNAPYLAYEPFADSQSVRFLNRQGFHWSLDAVQYRKQPGDAAIIVAEDDGRKPIDSKAEGVAQAIEPKPAKIEKDQPYSHLDRFFIPELRGPMFGAVGSTSTRLGVGASGGDMLGFHRWGLMGLYDFKAEEFSGSFQYLNRMWAPFDIALGASHDATFSVVDFSGVEFDQIRRSNQVYLKVSALFFETITAGAGFRFVDYQRDVEAPVDTQRKALGGGTFLLNYFGVEATPYVGIRRGIQWTLEGGHYPDISNTLQQSLTDLRANLALTTPLPLWARHTLTLSATGRSLFGTPEAERMLQVGGIVAGQELTSESVGAVGSPFLPNAVVFDEPVRGYETLALLGQSFAGGELSYRAPLIFDVGSASTASVLPSVFFRQLTLQLFANAGTVWSANRRNLYAVGSSLRAETFFWSVPINITAQVAKRLAQDEAWSGLVYIGL